MIFSESINVLTGRMKDKHGFDELSITLEYHFMGHYGVKIRAEKGGYRINNESFLTDRPRNAAKRMCAESAKDLSAILELERIHNLAHESRIK